MSEIANQSEYDEDVGTRTFRCTAGWSEIINGEEVEKVRA
jgi:hypothetical protein